MPLSVFRGARLPGEAWTRRDAALAQAVKLLDWSRCPGCGEPRWRAHNPESTYRPKRVKCEACESLAVIEEHKPTEGEKYPRAFHYITEFVDD